MSQGTLATFKDIAMDTNYPDIIAFVLKQEGGYTNDPRDPGGPTNWGITIIDAKKYWKKDASAEDVKAMPLDVAKVIYRDKYWHAVSGPDIRDGLDLCTMDSAVNSGTGRADKWLAKALGAPSGLGYVKLAQLSKEPSVDVPKAIDAYGRTRLSFLQSLRTWSAFGKGWGRRVQDMVAKAKVIFHRSEGKTNPEIKKELQKDISKAQTRQQGNVATTGAATAGPTTAVIHYGWHWDFTHIGLSVLGLVLLVFLVREVCVVANYIQAHRDAIEEL